MIKKNENEKLQLKREDVLSVDIATHCGFYSVYEAGTWDLSKGHKEQHQYFYNLIADFVKKHDIKMIVAEDVNVGSAGKNFIAMRKLSELRGVLFLVCANLGLPEPKFLNVTSIKKWATGDGRADKKKMIEYCRSRWGIEPVDDNMADAVHIYKYFVRIYKL